MPTHRWGDYTPSGHLGRILDDKTPQLGGMLDGNGFTFNGAVAFEAQAGEALSKGNAVYVSGVSGNKPVVMKADADDAAKMPAFGIAETDANNNANVNVVTFGTVYEIDTSAYSAGDELYVSTTAGELTATKPTGATAKLQNIGKVIRSHASAGSIKVGGAGRTNAVPNLDYGTVFIGDSNNQAEQRALVEADISDFGTYLTAESDTLDSVTDRGATTTNAITVGNLTSTGIDDNATSRAITVSTAGKVTLDPAGSTQGTHELSVREADSPRITIDDINGTDTDVNAALLFRADTTNKGVVGYVGTDELYVENKTAAGSVILGTADIDRLVINSSGTVSIQNGSGSGSNGNLTLTASSSGNEGGQINFNTVSSGTYSIDTHTDNMRFLNGTTSGDYYWYKNSNSAIGMTLTGAGDLDVDGVITADEFNTPIQSATNLAVGWYTIGYLGSGRAGARFAVWDTSSGRHQYCVLYASHMYGNNNSNTINILTYAVYSGSPIQKFRLKESGTYDGAALQVYIDDATNSVSASIVGDNVQSPGWTLADWVDDATNPGVNGTWSSFVGRAEIDLADVGQGGISATGNILAGGDVIVDVPSGSSSGFYGPDSDYGFEISDGGVGGKTVRIKNTGNTIFQHNHVQNVIDLNTDVEIDGEISSGKVTITDANYDSHLELNRSSEQWRLSPSTDGSLDIRRVSGTGTATIDAHGDIKLESGYDIRLPLNTNNIAFEAANVDITANSGRSGVVRFNNTASDTWTGFSSATGGRDWHYLHRDADCGLYDNTAGQWKSRFTTGAGATLYYGTVGRLSTTGSGASTVGHHEITAGQLIGGVGAETTGGTTNWNDSTNARSGNGHTLLLGTHTNGPGPSAYFHPFSFEFDNKDGTGNMTQLAVPYRGGLDVANNKLYMRSRYSGTWTSWVEVGGTLTTLQIPDANTTISEGSANTLRFSTNSGYVDVGPMNTSYCHFQTDRSLYYFNTTTMFDGGGIRAYDNSADARFPLYYDNQDTAYYCDPASTSRFNVNYSNEHSTLAGNGYGLRFWNSDSYKIYMSSIADATWGGDVPGSNASDYAMYFRMTGGTNRGFIFRNNTLNVAKIDGNGVYSGSGVFGTGQYLDLKYNASGGGGVRLYDSDSTLQGYWYGNGAGEHGFLDNDGAWAVRIRTGTNQMQLRVDNNPELYVYTSYVRAIGSMRSPIFYDFNNTSYYAHLDSTGDSIRAAGDIVAYYSDERLKDIEGPIENALDKVSTLNGFYYRGNEKAQKLGYDDKLKVGLSAQEVQKVLPEVIKSCPADNQYMTLDYSKVVPLLVEAIKELKSEIEELKK